MAAGSGIKLQPAIGIPPETMPVVFVDGVAAMQNSHQVAKITFVRTMANLSNPAEAQNQAVLQIAMSVDTLITMQIFINNQVERMISSGNITTQQVEIIRSVLMSSLKNNP